MIVDREGDLVVTEDGSTMLDVGGFLMKPTPMEIAERVDLVFALIDRKSKRMGKRLEPVGEDWDGTLKPLKDLMTAPDCRNPPMCRCRVLPWVNIPVVQFMPGEPLPAAVTSPSLEMTEPQQLDSCTGR